MPGIYLFISIGADPKILKKGGVCLHDWTTQKILGFRWFKKTKITLETVSFWRNTSLSIFRFSPFLYLMKACRWNLINISKFTNALIEKREDIIRKGIRRIAQEMLNRVVDNHTVRVTTVLSYSNAVHGTNVVLITEKV